MLDVAPRRADRRLLLAFLVGVVLVALVLAGTAVAGRLRPGASSPTALATKVVAALDDEDVTALVRLVDPAERPALLRLADAWTDRLDELRLPESVSGRPSAGGPLDGLDLTLSGLHPTVQMQGGDLAVVRFDRGTIRVQTDTAKAHGLLRAWLTHLGGGSVDATYPLDGVPVLGSAHLAAVERSGRWYVSVLGTLATPEVDPAASLDTAPSGTTGSSSAESAVRATIDGFYNSLSRVDPTPLAATLDESGADVVRLYAAPAAGGRDAVAPDHVETYAAVANPATADRATVLVRELTVTGPEPLSILGACATAGEQGRRCLRPGGYRYDRHTPSLGLFELLGHDGSFTLTAVHGRDGWRTSLPDTVADALIAYGAGLTREQLLAVLDEVATDTPTGVLLPDQARDVAFSTAGYALATVHVSSAGLYRVAPSPGGFNRATLYDPDGQPSIQPFYPNDSAYRLTPGDHTLLVWADDAFAATLTAPRVYRQRVEVRTVG